MARPAPPIRNPASVACTPDSSTASHSAIPAATYAEVRVTPKRLSPASTSSASITANLSPELALGDALNFMDQTAREILPAGYTTDLNGQSREFRSSSGSLALVFVLGAGYLTLLFAGVALIIGWGYSEPPLKLDSRGLGETAIVLLSCFLLPTTAYYIQTSNVSLFLLQVNIPLGLITFAVTLATEVPDIAADQDTGKITLAVRMQRKKSVKLHVAFFIAGCLSLIAGLMRLWPLVGLFSAMVVGPAIIVSLAVATASNRGDIRAMERIGLLYSFVLGSGAVALNIALIIGSHWFILA